MSSAPAASEELAPVGLATPVGPETPIGDQKQRLSEEDIANKREGIYLTGFPVANYDPNVGFGAGVTAFLYDNGKRNDPLFQFTPYRHRVFGVAFFTSRGLQFHEVQYDAPYLGGSLYRLRAGASYERNIVANHFGVGSASMNDLSYSGGADRTFGSAPDYERDQEQLRPDGTTYSRYNNYLAERPSVSVSLERDMFGGVVRPLVGYTISRVNIRDYSGDTVRAVDPATGMETVGRQATTKLAESCAAGRVLGCTGGWDSTIKLGVAFDSRDFEPDPNRGLFVDLVGELGTRYTGASYDYLRVTFSPKVFYSPFPKLADVVLAARGVFSAQTGNVPFYSLNTLSFSQRNADGLGGLRTLRGYRQDRFVGHVATLVNLEIRYTFWHFDAFGERFALIASPFLDMGRVYDRVDQLSLKNWRRTQGGALRLAWNQATIVGVDYAVNDEDSGVYVDFNYIF